MDVTIDYCTECGHLDKAVEAAREILAEHGESFEKLELVPSEGGVLRISIESEVVFDLDEEDFSVSDINQEVADYLQEQE
ncbi:MAG: Rdx family protein [Candidatus Nanohaloarchaea archaeon]